MTTDMPRRLVVPHVYSTVQCRAGTVQINEYTWCTNPSSLSSAVPSQGVKNKKGFLKYTNANAEQDMQFKDGEKDTQLIKTAEAKTKINK